MIYEITHERRKSDQQWIKYRKSEDLGNQFQPSEQGQNNNSQQKQSLNFSGRSSFFGIDNPLLSQDSFTDRNKTLQKQQILKKSNDDEFQIDIEQPLPVIHTLDHDQRRRCRAETVKNDKCLGDCEESIKQVAARWDSQTAFDFDDALIRKYNKHAKRDYKTDPYYVKLVDLHGYQRIKHELQNYNDHYMLLNLRKIIVYISFTIPIVAKYILQTILFQCLMTVLILFNVTLYIIVKTEHRTDTDTFEQIINTLFFIEIGLRMIADGLLFSKRAYFMNFSNIFDFSVVLLSAMNLYRPDLVILDLSPLRIITLLLYLGDIFDGLQVMLNALKQSIKYILEALVIVGLFSLFFALVGLYLFQGLFNYRCVNLDGTLGDSWVQCNVNSCPDEMVCQFVNETPDLPSSFNNIVFSYGQILRTITQDGWAFIMFFTIRVFYPHVWIYFLLIIFVGGFFGFNLVIAVLKTHYAEATQEFFHHKEQIEIKRQLEEQRCMEESRIRDTSDIFDVAMLRFIGFHQTYVQYYKQLHSIKNIHHSKLENVSVKPISQPRLLSSKQITNNSDKSFLDKLKIKLRNLGWKNLLLPKFQYLNKQKESINIKHYTEDEDILTILENIMQFEFSQLSRQVNPNQYQQYTSFYDVLPSFLQVISSKNLDEQKEIDYSKAKFPIQYPIPEQGQNQYRSSMKFSYKFPIKKSFRTNRRIAREIRSQDSFATHKPCIRHERKTYKAFTKYTMKSTQSVPFIIRKGNVTYLFIQGYYLPHDKIANKMKLKIEKEKFKQIKMDMLYNSIRKKDLENQLIQDHHWSGNEILDMRFSQFNMRNVLLSINTVDHDIWLKGLLGKIQIIRKYINRIITSKLTEMLYDLLIFINFTFLALYGIVDAPIISNVEDITTILLTVETFLRYCSISYKEISKSNQMILQTLIVLLNFIELTMSGYMRDLTEQNLRLIRGTKCLLFYRCMKYNSMAVTIGYIASMTFKQYIYLTFLFFMVILLYALIGMEMYAGQFDQNNVLGQLHSFDNILKSLMTVFNIMTNDDWYGVFVLGTSINQTFAVVYSYSMVIILNYLTYGLVLAILLDGFGKYLDQQIFQEIEEREKPQLQQQNTDQMETQNTQQPSEFPGRRQSSFPQILKLNNQKQKIALIQHLIKSIRQINQHILDQNPELFNGVYCEQSLFFFDKTNKFRRMCMALARAKFYVLMTDLLILTSIILFTLQTYNDYEEDSSTLPMLAQFYINILLALDVLINIIAKGLFYEQGTYLTSIWQVTDLVYIISFFIQYHQGDTVKPIFKILLYFGYLRPFILLNRISFLAVLSTALYKSMLDILNVLLTLFSVWIIFGVYGIILYANQFGFCNTKVEFKINQAECLASNGTWVNFKHNFDNITIAIPTLFAVSTFDGWGEIMQIAENSQLPSVGPVPFNSYIQTYVFFISFCFIGSMFFLSLFTGVLFSNLKANQRKIEKGDLNQNQKEFIKIAEIITKDVPVFSSPPDVLIRKLASKIMNNSVVQLVFFVILLLDLLNNTLFYSSMPLEFLEIINLIHHCFSFALILYGLIQYLALGLYRFFDNYWRKFLFFLMLIAAADLSIDFKYDWVKVYFFSNPFDEYYKILRVCFALRSFRLILIFQGLINIQRLMRVLVYALPFLGKILFILIDTMIVFALFGCQLYGQIYDGEVIDDQINFHNIAQAMLTLFKCASGDDWRTIMTDTMHHNPNCQSDSSQCGSMYSQVYFFLFMLLSNYVFLNLFVLGLIEQFESFFQVQNSIIQTYVENVDRIKTIWCKYSPETQGKAMHYKFLCRFLLDIGAPLGRSKEENLWDAAKQASQFKLKCDHHGYIQYNQLIYEMFRTCFLEDVFKTGSKNSIKQIKQYNKEMQLKLMNYRRNLFIKRANISLIDLRTNFNILHDYLNVLIAFKAWESHSNKTMRRAIKSSDYSENQDSSQDDVKQLDEDQLQLSGHSFLNQISIRGSMPNSDTDRFQPIVTDENQQTKHLLTSLSQEEGAPPNIPCYKDNIGMTYNQDHLFLFQPELQ